MAGGEATPSWARHLGWGARANLKQGLRYLQATGDSAFKPRQWRFGTENPA
jgi:hypothetical protein